MPRASRGPRPGPDHPCRAHHASGWPRSTCAGSGRLPLGGTGAWGSEATLHRPGRPDPRGASQKGQLRQNQPDWLPPGLSQQGPCACGGGGRVPLSLSSPLGLSSQASNATHHNYLSCRAHSCKDLTKKPARTTTKPARTTHTCALEFPFHPAKVSAVYSPPSAPFHSGPAEAPGTSEPSVREQASRQPALAWAGMVFMESYRRQAHGRGALVKVFLPASGRVPVQTSSIKGGFTGRLLEHPHAYPGSQRWKWASLP